MGKLGEDHLASRRSRQHPGRGAGDELKRAALCLTAQSRAVHCARALEGFALDYGFQLASFSQPETERVCRYLELLAHSAQ